MGERRLVGLAIVLGLLGGLLVGCKSHATRPPRRDVSGMNVDEIERQLALNREDLEAAGVWVPEPTPPGPAPSAEPPPATEPEPPPDTGAESPEDELVQESGAADESEPMPASAPEPSDAPALDATVSRRPRRSRVDREVRRESRTRCDRICDLADVTCDLMDQICALAAKHPHEVRYHAACERAELQCDAAARECELCSD